MSNPPRTGPAAGSQYGSSVASNGLGYLAGWTSDSLSRPRQAYVAAVRSDGVVQSPIGARLDPEAVASFGVALTSSRDGYFAAWTSERGLNAAMVDSFARVMKRAATPIGNVDVNRQDRAYAARNGALYLAVGGPPSQMRGMLLDDSGRIVRGDIDLSGGEALDAVTTVVPHGNGFLVLVAQRSFDQQSEIYGRKVSADGTAAPWFVVRSVTSYVSSIAAGTDGSHSVLSWCDQFGLWISDLDPSTGVAVSTRQLLPDRLFVTDVLLTGGKTWVSYQSLEANVFVLDATGSPLSPIFVGRGSAGDLASNGASVLATFISAGTESPVNSTNLVGRVVQPALGPVQMISRSETNQASGEVVDGGSTMLAVWDEEIDERRQVFVDRFGADRRLLDGAGLQISEGKANANPVASFNGAAWLVVWARQTESSWQVVARRVASSGELVGEELTIASSAYEAWPRVAFDGTNWLVAWTAGSGVAACGNVGSASQLYVARIAADGRVLDAGGKKIETLNRMDQYEPDLAWDGHDYIVVWRGNCTRWHQSTLTSIAAARIDRDLTRIESFPLTRVVAGENAQLRRPKVAAGAGSAVVAWEQHSGVTVTTSFRFVDGLPQEVSRRRSVGIAAPVGIEGELISLDHSPSRGFRLDTESVIPWANAYTGIFERVLVSDGEVSAPNFRFVQDPVSHFLGHVVDFGGTRWLAERRYDRDAGAERMWLRDLD